MENPSHPRVVVGVKKSVPGYAALRTAVGQARARRTPLYALLAVPAIVEDMRSYIFEAFAEALGTMPEDVDVHLEVYPDYPVTALTTCACDPRDLIVVGNSRKGPLRALWSGSVARGVLTQARCSVLVVPGPEMQRATRHSARRLHAGRTDVWDRFESELPQLHGSRGDGP